MNDPAKQPLELPAATYEPQLSASIDLERCLSREVLLHAVIVSIKSNKPTNAKIRFFIRITSFYIF